MGCIYAITCSDRYYIGSTKNFHKRMAEHKSDLQRGRHKNTYMQRVYDKYGCFEYKILESVEEDKLIEREQVLLDRHFDDPKCMNRSPHAHRAYNPWTEESRKKLSETCKGRKHTAETKKKMSDAKKGKNLTRDHIANLIKARHKNAKVYTSDVIFKWNDSTYEIASLAEFLELFGKSSRCIFRRLAANKNTVITLSRVREDTDHPFKNGDKLCF